MGTPDHERRALLEAARARALEVACARVAREREDAEALRASVVPRVRAAVASARAEGLLGGSVWLIGSYAWGEPTAASDVDLLVERCDEPFGTAGRLEDALQLHVDVITMASADAALLPHLVRHGVPL